MKYLFIDKKIKYDGTQLRSHFIFEQTGIIGDAIVAFIGEANVPLKNMVDLVDVKAKENIYSPLMLHFIVEHFDRDLNKMILKQRLLSAIAFEELIQFDKCENLMRFGDDLFDKKRKLSVSIATISPVSCLIHFGINIRNDKTPVPTVGLKNYSVDPKSFADIMMKRYKSELEALEIARCKVRPVP